MENADSRQKMKKNNRKKQAIPCGIGYVPPKDIPAVMVYIFFYLNVFIFKFEVIIVIFFNKKAKNYDLSA